MRGRAVIDGVMLAVGAALLVSVPARAAVGWDAWAALVVAGAALGVLAAAVARKQDGRGLALALVLALGPTAVLARAGAGYAFTYLVAHAIGTFAGRQWYPADTRRR